jgi:hypothetical protein
MHPMRDQRCPASQQFVPRDGQITHTLACSMKNCVRDCRSCAGDADFTDAARLYGIKRGVRNIEGGDIDIADVLAPSSLGKDGAPLCCFLLCHAGKELLGAFAHFRRAQVFFVCGDAPAIAKRIHKAAVAVTPELVGHRH